MRKILRTRSERSHLTIRLMLSPWTVGFALAMIVGVLVAAWVGVNWGVGTLLAASVSVLAVAQGFATVEKFTGRVGLGDKPSEEHERTSVAPDRPNASEASLGADAAASGIVSHAVRVFGSREKALDWLNRPAIALDNQVPLDLIDTEHGRKTVTDHLDRIDYGVYT